VDETNTEVERGQVMSNERVRVLRVLEYTGPREWVEETLKRRAIIEEWVICGDAKITEGFLGRYPEPVIESAAPSSSEREISEILEKGGTRDERERFAQRLADNARDVVRMAAIKLADEFDQNTNGRTDRRAGMKNMFALLGVD